MVCHLCSLIIKNKIRNDEFINLYNHINELKKRNFKLKFNKKHSSSGDIFCQRWKAVDFSIEKEELKF